MTICLMLEAPLIFMIVFGPLYYNYVRRTTYIYDYIWSIIIMIEGPLIFMIIFGPL